VGVALLLAEGRAGLNALLGVADGAAQRLPAGSQAKRAHHQAGVAKDGLGLGQPLPFHAANQPVGRDVDIFEEEGGRVAGANAVLVFRLAFAEAGGIPVYHKPGGAAGGQGQNGVEIGHAPLLIHCFCR
jgi:hypothetical protein